MINRYLLTIIFVLITIAAGVGSIILEFHQIAGIILIVLGVAAAVFQIIASAMKNAERDQILEVQNTLLASAGVGNVPYKVFESQLQQSGKSKNAINYLKKAYSLNKDDVDVAKWLSSTLALRLAFIGWARGTPLVNMKSNAEWKFAMEVAEHGLKLNPQERMFMDTLGILYDVSGDHELARKWFLQSSKLREDPYWHLLMATSWGMSGNISKGISEIEQAIKEGAKGWVVNSSYGMALEEGGRPSEALYQLAQAKKVIGMRGMHYVYRLASLHAQYTLAQFSYNSIIDWSYSMAFLIMTDGWHLLKQVIPITLSLLLSIRFAFSRSLWTITAKNHALAKMHYRLYAPDGPAFFRGCQKLQQKDYTTALNFFQVCLSICPDSVRVLTSLSFCYALLGDRMHAIQVTDRALSIEPNNPLLIWNREQFASAVELRPRDISPKDFRNLKRDHKQSSKRG